MSFRRLRRGWARLDAWLMQWYALPARREAARRQRDHDDLLRLLVFAEALGLDSPLAWYAPELKPLLLEEFHDWHRRAGLPHSPLDHWRCC